MNLLRNDISRLIKRVIKLEDDNKKLENRIKILEISNGSDPDKKIGMVDERKSTYIKQKIQIGFSKISPNYMNNKYWTIFSRGNSTKYNICYARKGKFHGLPSDGMNCIVDTLRAQKPHDIMTMTYNILSQLPDFKCTIRGEFLEIMHKDYGYNSMPALNDIPLGLNIINLGWDKLNARINLSAEISLPRRVLINGQVINIRKQIDDIYYVSKEIKSAGDVYLW